jgi:hypothetical protein
MAGPFSSTGNQAVDITPVQLQGGFTPAPSLAEAGAAALGAVLPAIREERIKDIQEDVTNQTESIKEALLAQRNPALAKSLFKEEALANPITAQAFKEFTQIQDAAASGKLPRQFALERLEAIQDTAIANAPEFEKEIRAAMTTATGIDPNRATFADLLSTQKQALSAEQKAFEKLQIEAIQNGVTVEQQQEFNNVALQAQHAQNVLNQRKANGTYSLLDTQKEVTHRGGVIMLDLLGQVRRQAQGGEVTPEFMANIKTQAKANIAASISAITAASDGVTGPEIAAAIKPLELLNDAIDGMADDGSLLKLTQNNNLLTKSLLEDALLRMPEHAAAWTFGGERGFQALLDYQAQAPTKASEQVLAELSPRARGAFKLRQVASSVVTKQYGLLGSGVPAETAEDRQGRLVAAGLVFATPGMEEEKYVTAEKEMNALGEDHVWTAFASRKVANATKTSNALKASLISLQESNTSGLAQEFAQLRANGANVDAFKFEGDKLTFAFDAGTTSGGIAPGVSDTSAERAFVARFNRANQISSLHRRSGNLPAARYTNTEQYWETVTTLFDKEVAEKSGQPQTKPPANVVQWGRDEQGRPIRLK